MGLRIYTVNDGVQTRFVLYDTTIDQFCSPPTTLEACLEETGDNREVFTNDPLNLAIDLSPDMLNRVSYYLGILERGESVEDQAAAVLGHFYRFLTATVAPHQYDYPALEQAVMVRINELGLQEQFPDDDWFVIATNGAVYPAFQDQSPSVSVTPQQNKLAGFYVLTLAKEANLLGDTRMHPFGIMEKSYKMSCTRHVGT